MELGVRHTTIDPPAAMAPIAPAPPGTSAPVRDRWWISFALFWLAACAWLLWSDRAAIATGALPDTDDNLRLLQVRDWLAGQGWFDLRQYRLDPPFGADIHWSRLVDLPLAALIRGLVPLLGPAQAEIAAAVIVPLITLGVAMLAAAVIARRTIAPAAWPWAAFVLLMASPVLGMLSSLRIDHHGWQIAALLWTIAGLVDPIRRRGGITAGIAVAASLAIGVEMLPLLAIALGCAALRWIGEAGEAARLRALAPALAGGTIAAWIAFVPPGAGWTCDALSPSWALPIGLACAGLAVAMRLPDPTPRGRTIAIGLIAILAGLALAGPTGRCLSDPYAAVDPVARRLWLAVVSESLPLLKQTPETIIGTLILPAIGLIGCGAMLRRDPRAAVWWAMALLLAGGIALTFLQTRSAVATQALAVPGAAALGWLVRQRIVARRSVLVRVFGTVALMLCVTGLAPRIALAVAIGDAPDDPAAVARERACLAPPGLRALDRLPAATLLATIDATPAIIAHSHHRGLAGPYHRNGRAIGDVMTIWAGNDATARPLLARHGATHVALCGLGGEGAIYARRAPDGLHARLSRGAVPAWLVRVPLAGTPWRIYRITGR